MNKIYNNLSIENLVKTNWFKQFNNPQQLKIIEGLEANLDISYYAKKEFNPEQMNQILQGLKQNLNVLVYAKKEFNEYQM